MRSQTEADVEVDKLPIRRHVPDGDDDPALLGAYCSELPAKVPPGATVEADSGFRNAYVPMAPTLAPAVALNTSDVLIEIDAQV